MAALRRHAPQRVYRRAAATRFRPCVCAARRACGSAGQITGAEGYVEAAACGAIAAIAAARALRGAPSFPPPPDTAHGAVVAHLQNTASPDFQPANVTWAPFGPLPAVQRSRDKRERRARMAQRALALLDAWIAAERAEDALSTAR